MKVKRRTYPPKHKARRKELIKKTKPWTRATGPKTQEGKSRVKYNALKHGARSAAFTKLRKTLLAANAQLNQCAKKYAIQHVNECVNKQLQKLPLDSPTKSE